MKTKHADAVARLSSIVARLQAFTLWDFSLPTDGPRVSDDALAGPGD
jgi:hypothetical protein